MGAGAKQRSRGLANWKIITVIATGILLVILIDYLPKKVTNTPSPASENLPVSENPRPLADPATWVISPHATRDLDGGVVISASTNIPDGVKIMVQLKTGASSKVQVTPGGFSSEGFSDKGKPLMAGPHEVSFVAYFNEAWEQPAAVLELTGRDGRKLQGKLFRETDADVVDSPKILEYRTNIDFPSIPREGEAILLVKSATLVVDGNRSSATVGETVNQFVQPSTGISYLGKGWSAIQKGPDIYEVHLDVVDAANDGPAIWEADLRSRKVRYVNLAAKLMSYEPPY